MERCNLSRNWTIVPLGAGHNELMGAGGLYLCCPEPKQLPTLRQFRSGGCLRGANPPSRESTRAPVRLSLFQQCPKLFFNPIPLQI